MTDNGDGTITVRTAVTGIAEPVTLIHHSSKWGRVMRRILVFF